MRRKPGDTLRASLDANVSRRAVVLGGIAAATAATTGALPAAAQSWPAKPIRFVVPYAPGGIADIAARVIGQKLSEAWGQQIIVDNRPGGSGTIGTAAVAKAAPDGYTILVATTGDFVLSPVLLKDIPYNVETELMPVTTLTDTPCVLAVNVNAPYKSMKDVIDDAKSRPGKVSYASPGNGGINQLLMEWFALGTGTSFQHIPYKGGAPAGAAVAAGDVPLGLLAVSSAQPHLKSGRVRMLAATTAKRNPFIADVPTMQELGVPDVDGTNYTAMMAPRGTPQAIIDKLHAEVVKVLGLPDVKERLSAGAAVPIPATPAETAARFKRELAAARVIVEKAKITAD